MKMLTPPRQLACSIAGLVLAATVLGACSNEGDLGPQIPSGVTEIGGPPVTSAPPPPAGWSPKDVIPASQQQAQDTIVSYLRKTLQALPAGSALDSDGYAAAGHNIGCDDDATNPKTAPIAFETIGNLTVPGNVDTATVIKKVGDIWRSWGWYVFERDGFTKPNLFGYGPDGYHLQILAANPPSYPPTLQGSTPCFPGELRRDDVVYPPRLSAKG